MQVKTALKYKRFTLYTPQLKLCREAPVLCIQQWKGFNLSMRSTQASVFKQASIYVNLKEQKSSTPFHALFLVHQYGRRDVMLKCSMWNQCNRQHIIKITNTFNKFKSKRFLFVHVGMHYDYC